MLKNPHCFHKSRVLKSIFAMDYIHGTGGAVGWAPGCHAGGLDFGPSQTNTQGLKNNWGECATFVILSANLWFDFQVFSDKDYKP